MNLHMIGSSSVVATFLRRGENDRTGFDYYSEFSRLVALTLIVIVPVCMVQAASPNVDEKWFSVKDFGAVGDGTADDRVAIQRAIEAVKEAGGGTVYFPEGVYTVTAPEKESWKPQIELCRKLTILGDGMNKSVIRVANEQGPYDLIFLGVDLDHVRIVDIAFDGNGETNPVICETDSVPSPWHHMLFHFNSCRDVSFLRCRFTDLSGVWAIFASERMARVAIHSCQFDRIGGFTENDFDHSCVYFEGDGLSMIDNRFASRFGAGTTGARTAAEIHGSNVCFSDNRINGFRYGVNVCSGGEGTKSDSSVHQVYRDNWLTDVGCGFAIWGLEDRAFDDLDFSRNTISINGESWKEFFPEFFGIGLVSYKDMPPPKLMKNVRLIDNVINYVSRVGGTPRCCGVRFDFAKFTDEWEARPSGRLENIEMRGNRISGAYSCGIDLHCVGADIRVFENLVIDPARGDLEIANKCAIRLRGVLNDVNE